MKIPMGIHANRREDGCGAGWAKEQWTAGWVKALSSGGCCAASCRGTGDYQRGTEDGRGVHGEEQGGWVGRQKAEEAFTYVTIFLRMTHPFI